jgi:arginine-tRNA-protein transferase
MIKDLDFPEHLTGPELDAYLEKGWYRLGQIIFTTDFIPHEETWCPVFWLRFQLDQVNYGKKQLKLLKANQHFDVQIKPLEITDETEELYQAYKSSVSFEISPTVRNYLFDGSVFGAPGQNVFQSNMIEIRDRGRLIATGVFDNGDESMAGIMNFYHPAYYKYSPGKFLMLLKINHAIEKGMTWYYPGYIAYGYSKFDYKLFPDPNAAEIFDPQSRLWLPYTDTLLSSLSNNRSDSGIIE